MPDYKKMYHIMFNAATDAERISTAKASKILRKAQRECEEIYLESPEEPIILHSLSKNRAAGG